MRQTGFFVFLGHFLHFYLPPLHPCVPWMKILKLKKTPCDIIILHVSTINDNHMMYGSWDMEHDGQNFLKFWTVFRPFFPLKNRKIKILKQWKKCLEILPSYIGVPVYHKLQSYDVWFLRYQARRTEFFVILDPFTTVKTKKIKILKKMEKNLEILSFCTCAP